MNDLAVLPGIARAMLDPSFYPERPARVDLIQTQMSFVFLVGDIAYKVKKPVNLGYLDYSTLEKRRFFCEREVDLNRRLCPDVYLGVVPISQSGTRFSLGGSRDVVEYAVKMRRLPPDRMLNTLLERDSVSGEMVSRVAERVAEFHARAVTNDGISAYGSVSTIIYNTEENFAQTKSAVGLTITPRQYARIAEFTRNFIAANRPLLEERVGGGRIRDCHGDLHAAHICFVDGICIYDCIEFNDRFRYGDVASEVAFLAMDLDHYGKGGLSHEFVRAYVRCSQDARVLELVPFYKCYRAYVRGKVEGFKLNDPAIAPPEKESALKAAASYFDLASFYTRQRPALFVTVGVTGTGKSTLARALARVTGAVVVASDVVRKQLAGLPPTQHSFDAFGTGLYSPDLTRKTYATMLAQGREMLNAGQPVILDATFGRRSDREQAIALANETGADYFFLECVLTDSLIREYLSRREKETSVSDGRLEILTPQMKEFEPPTEITSGHRITLDMSRPVDAGVRQIMDFVTA